MKAGYSEADYYVKFRTRFDLQKTNIIPLSIFMRIVAGSNLLKPLISKDVLELTKGNAIEIIKLKYPLAIPVVAKFEDKIQEKWAEAVVGNKRDMYTRQAIYFNRNNEQGRLAGYIYDYTNGNLLSTGFPHEK